MGRESRVRRPRHCESCGDFVRGNATEFRVHAIECKRIQETLDVVEAALTREEAIVP